MSADCSYEEEDDPLHHTAHSIVDRVVLSLEHNSHNENKGLVSFVRRVQCAAKDQASINHQNFPKRYIEENGYKRL